MTLFWQGSKPNLEIVKKDLSHLINQDKSYERDLIY